MFVWTIRKQFGHFVFPFDFGFGFGLRLVLVAMGQVTRFFWAAALAVAFAFFGLLVRVFLYTYEERMRPVVDLAADALVPVAAVKNCFS
tara:strand:+ start:1519 stop:1785 length:267 start_codon:yes stop_codon:yes gene_type:complete